MAINMMGEALAAMAADPYAKPTAKFKMGQEYITLFLQLDNHIMKEQNAKADAKLKQLEMKRRAMAIDDANHPANKTSASDPSKPLEEPKFVPSMAKS